MAKLDMISTTKADNTTALTLSPISQIGRSTRLADLATVVANPALKETMQMDYRPGNLSSSLNGKTTIKNVIPFESVDANGNAVTLYASRVVSYNIPVGTSAEICDELIDRSKVDTTDIVRDSIVHGASPY